MSAAEGLPGAVLFVCTHNAIRSPMAAELMRLRFGPLVRIDSVGVRPSDEVSAMAAFVVDTVVDWSLPTTSVAANTSLYLGFIPASNNGVTYWNLNGATPPKLIITAQ